jgi:hypothetical protein
VLEGGHEQLEAGQLLLALVALLLAVSAKKKEQRYFLRSEGRGTLSQPIIFDD